MTISQLEYFLAIANHGSFSAAAKHCFVSQPSLSMQMSNLEDELGVILLDRTQKPIVPTETGLIVLEQAKEAVASFYSTKERVNELKDELSGVLRLGIIPTVSPYLLPKLIPEFLKNYPRVELNVRDMMPPDMINAFECDMIDVAIFSSGIPIKIKEIKLFDDKLYLYVSPKHELYSRSKISLDEVDTKQLLILSEGNTANNKDLRQLYLENQKAKPRYNLANSSLETMLHVVDTTSGITIIPGIAIDFIPEEKRKHVRPFAKINAYRKIVMAVRRTYIKETLVNALKESIITVSKDYALMNLLYS